MKNKDIEKLKTEIIDKEQIDSHKLFLKEQEEKYKMNIDSVTKSVTCKKTGIVYKVVEKTKNSVALFRPKNKNFYNTEYICSDCNTTTVLTKDSKFKCSKCKSKKFVSNKIIYTGIDSIQWYTMTDLNKYFHKFK